MKWEEPMVSVYEYVLLKLKLISLQKFGDDEIYYELSRFAYDKLTWNK